MKINQAQRQNVKIKMGIQGPSGSGKTIGALLLAYGLFKDWSKIVVIDSENKSSNLYSHLGGYNVIDLEPPFSPERYSDAILLAEQSGMEVIIIDSISHEWEGVGGVLDIHGSMVGNSFANWSKVTPRHNGFVQTLLSSKCHIISTVRTKTDYVLTDKNGKMVPEKVGLKGITRDGMDYEFTIQFELDIKHNAVATKDRTGLFSTMNEFKLSMRTGEQILEWCNAGVDVSKLKARIQEAKSIEELLLIHNTYPALQDSLKSEFTNRKAILSTPKPSQNGIHNSTTGASGTFEK